MRDFAHAAVLTRAAEGDVSQRVRSRMINLRPSLLDQSSFADEHFYICQLSVVDGLTSFLCVAAWSLIGRCDVDDDRLLDLSASSCKSRGVANVIQHSEANTRKETIISDKKRSTPERGDAQKRSSAPLCDQSPELASAAQRDRPLQAETREDDDQGHCAVNRWIAETW